ncbi:MAG: hypothetical protein Q8936_21185 [Bacillota bacterium]|nr:hypothetical protein [Bacillota bacterium]
MKVQQLFYTSCRKGLSLGAGFQTYSMSEGISEEEKVEIEGHCVYIPPDNLPTQPTKKEVEELFPTAFSFFRLKTGRQCICQAKYTGKDYSGRYGNYFCHVLVFEEDIDSFYSIQLFGSSVFRDCLTEEEENSENIMPLSTLNDISLGDIITLDSIGEFLKGNCEIGEKRSKLFKNVVNALIDYNEKKRRIIFGDSYKSGAFWVASIQMSMPRKLANNISFTTYAYNPENTNYILCASPKKGSGFAFSEVQREYQYYIFDFSSGVSSSVDNDYKFSKLAQVGFTISKESLLPFITFIDKFNYIELNREIDDCIYLYNMVKKGVEKVDYRSTISGINFANNYASTETLELIFNQVEPVLDKMSNEVDLKLTEAISRFLFKIARISEKNKGIENNYMKKAYDFFFNSIFHMVIDLEDIEIDNIIKLHNKIRDLNNESLNEFIRRSIGPDRLEDLAVHLRGGKVRHAEFYLIATLSNFMVYEKAANINVNWDEYGKDSPIMKFIDACTTVLINSQEGLDYVLRALYKNQRYFAFIIVKCYEHANANKGLSDNIAATLMKSFDEKGSLWTLEVRRCIEKTELGRDLLFSEYYIGLKSSENKMEYFKDYCQEAFSKMSEYRIRCFSDALRQLLFIYGKKFIAYSDYTYIFQYLSDNSIKLDFTVVEKFIQMFEAGLDIQYPDEKLGESIYQLLKYKKAKKIEIKPDIVKLISLGMEIEDLFYEAREEGTRGIHDIDLKYAYIELKQVNEQTYKQVLNWYLSNLCPMLTSQIEHGRMKQYLWVEKYSDMYFEEYLTVIRDLADDEYMHNDYFRKCKINGVKILLDFLLYVFKSSDDLSEELIIKVKRQSVLLLSDKSEQRVKACDEYMSKKISGMTRNKIRMREDWEDIYEKIIKSSKISVFKKIFRQ